MDNYELINYKWYTGVYSIEEICSLVEQKEITKEQFFDITRIYYDIIKQQIEKNKKRGIFSEE